MTIEELNQKYFEMIQQSDVSPADDYENLVTYVKNSTANYHGEYVRTCLVPKILRQEDMDRFARDMKLLYGIFEKIVKHYFEDEQYRAEFGFDKLAEELILGSRFNRPFLPMARIDFFFNEHDGSYKFCEFNTDGTSAMNEDRELNNGMLLTSVYEDFLEAHNGHTMELFDTWIDTVLRLFSAVRHTDKAPHVVITDYLEGGYIADFEYFVERFQARDIEASICDVRDLKYDGEHLYDDKGRVIDVIYRRAVTSDILANYKCSQALVEAQKDDKVLLLGDFHTQIIHNKEIFNMFFKASTRSLLTAKELAFIDEHVPYTGPFDKDRVAELKANKDKWILKPLDSYGSKGIYAGVERSQKEWEDVLDELSATKSGAASYIMQEFCTPFVTKNYGYAKGEGEFGLNDYYNLTGLYMYDGQIKGVLSRVSLTPIISTQYSEKSLPTIVVS